jgi:beta-galactosidase GanA
LQAGADSIATSPATYIFWWENFPNGTHWETSPAISAGNTAYVTVETVDGTEQYFMENDTTGN